MAISRELEHFILTLKLECVHISIVSYRWCCIAFVLFIAPNCKLGIIFNYWSRCLCDPVYIARDFPKANSYLNQTNKQIMCSILDGCQRLVCDIICQFNVDFIHQQSHSCVCYMFGLKMLYLCCLICEHFTFTV